MTQLSCPGFSAGGFAAGIKKKGVKDLGLLVSREPAAVAGVFTRNKVQAAPVILDRRRIRTGIARAIIVNSGNANCCTGDQGMRDAETITRTVAERLGIPDDQVLASSTGVIGAPMPMGVIQPALPLLVDGLSAEGFPEFARAILTTDTVPKISVRREAVNGRTFTLLGCAKGAGMIRPDMATMLCFVVSDVRTGPDTLQGMLNHAVNRSFNRITIDGDTSTNDTVLIMANGSSGVSVESEPQRRLFQGLLDDMLSDLARQLVRDGEGVTKLVDIAVQGAETDADAEKIADTVAHSNLVKTAFFGEDANWGRILGAAGRAGVPLIPSRIDLFFNGVKMVEAGVGCGPEAEARATEVLKMPEFTVTLDLNMGPGRAHMLTCDFSVDYVKINADYRS